MPPPSFPLRLVAPRPGPAPTLTLRPRDDPGPAPSGQDIGDTLVALGALAEADLYDLRAAEARSDADLTEILLARGLVTQEALAQAQAIRHGTLRADFVRRPPDLSLLDAVGVADCLRLGILPWHRTGGGIVVATARPDRFATLRARLAPDHGRIFMAIATEDDILQGLLTGRRRRLVERAETRVPEPFSSRRLSPMATGWRAALVAVAVGLGLVLAPTAAFLLALTLATLALLAMTGLRLAATVLALRRGRKAGDGDTGRVDVVVPLKARQPVVSLLVPLYRERRIATCLVGRLGRIDWPRELLDICLIVEEDDATTRMTLADTALPAHMRVVVVPRGTVRTKPRALNFALDFARGSIIGVYDAEDAPAPDQIRRIVDRFQTCGPDVACLQGVLDYYNARQSWITRCFTIEYAGWFRVILPALEHLRLPVPLGGTTLFFRRAALERLGAWDAHNVTEDADLGMRLARAGLRTELVGTVTTEEATARPGAWVRQRSRWLKGYAMTWLVHMRRPGQLWRDLGPRGFAGFQVLFVGTLAQVLLAPVLWSFWGLLLTGWHPAIELLPTWLLWGLAGAFLLSEVSAIALGLVAVRGAGHGWLMPWVPTLHLYNMAATLAAWKGVAEVVARPFHWEKTSHGHSLTGPDAERRAGPVP